MERVKPSPHEVYEVLDEKKKLLEIRAQIDTTLEKVKQVLNSLAVENYQLTQTELDAEDEKLEPIAVVDIKQEVNNPVAVTTTVHETVINQQLLDIDIKPCVDDIEIDSDEELDQL